MSVFYFDSEHVLNPKCAFSLSKQCKLCCPRVKNGAKAIRCASLIQMSVIIAPVKDSGLIYHKSPVLISTQAISKTTSVDKTYFCNNFL